MLSLSKMQKEIVASFEAIQKAQRLLAGDPQEIHEHRRNGEAPSSQDDVERRVKAMLETRKLGTSKNTAGYQVDSAPVIDAESTPVEQPKALSAGEAVAKSDDEPANTA